MPRMSKKRRLEWAFFLNERNRITFNALCRGCTHDCKQSFMIALGKYILVQNPPMQPLDTKQLDYVYSLPYERWYPKCYESPSFFCFSHDGSLKFAVGPPTSLM